MIFVYIHVLCIIINNCNNGIIIIFSSSIIIIVTIIYRPVCLVIAIVMKFYQ